MSKPATSHDEEAEKNQHRSSTQPPPPPTTATHRGYPATPIDRALIARASAIHTEAHLLVNQSIPSSSEQRAIFLDAAIALWEVADKLLFEARFCWTKEKWEEKMEKHREVREMFEELKKIA